MFNNEPLLVEAGSYIKIYSFELKISDEAEGRIGYIFSDIGGTLLRRDTGGIILRV